MWVKRNLKSVKWVVDYFDMILLECGEINIKYFLWVFDDNNKYCNVMFIKGIVICNIMKYK